MYYFGRFSFNRRLPESDRRSNNSNNYKLNSSGTNMDPGGHQKACRFPACQILLLISTCFRPVRWLESHRSSGVLAGGGGGRGPWPLQRRILGGAKPVKRAPNAITERRTLITQ